MDKPPADRADAAGVGVCAPGETICADGGAYRVCAADGSGYGAVAACAGGRVCSEGMCLDPSEVPNPAVQVAAFTATVSGDRQVTVDATASSARETSGAELEVRWSFNNDGQYTAWSTDKVATFTYPEYGEYTIALQVRDGVGQTASRTQGVSFSDITYVGGAVSSSTT